MGCGNGFRIVVEEFRYLAHDNNVHGSNDDEEFDITDLFQSNMD